MARRRRRSRRYKSFRGKRKWAKRGKYLKAGKIGYRL